jgi:RNA recognition motif-containing protein
MGTRLFIGNLSFHTTEEALKQHMSQAGTVVSCNLVADKMTGRSRGFAFADMASQEETNNAIELLNGKELDGRQLKINEARPREERPSSSSGSGRHRDFRDRRRDR